ncbi:sodium transport ATPase [Ascodesmis nigricans]|uniref:P-type Na(+) transporter n=1 Tax=Ascodesmis nigricans TaxID=341454 RepID=A0A4S2MPI8_9PEZI|nr:sodium transport ATPase [Ascodesmis nigricans]
MAASFGMLDYIEGSVIAAVICLNIVIGFVQDYRAEKTMQSLHSLSAPVATVIRDGKVEKVKAELLVKGDIVKISVGDVVPADLRVLESMNLETNEALLTGESLPIAKSGYVIMKDELSPIGDRQNMVWSSSTVTKGRGTGIVVATGMQTQVGTIAELLRGKTAVQGGPLKRFLLKVQKSAKNILGLVGTPLQVKLSKFALLLFGLAILLAIIVFSSAKWKITGETLIYGICVAVAVIPESLIAVLTITMAVGTKTMAKGNVIVRKMQALEAVGGVTNICSDKTGTLTQGKMIARKAFIPGLGEIRIDGVQDPFDPTNGKVFFGDEEINSDYISRSRELALFLEGVAVCNLATVHRSDPTNLSSEKVTSQWKATGEPTEISLQVLAMRFGYGKEDLMRTGEWDLVTEHPFDSTVKKMSIVHHHRGRDTVEAFMKGAGEVVVPTLNISEARKEEIMAMIERLAGEGLRVLCVAHKHLINVDPHVRSEVENGMNFIGLVGLYDPPRVETKDAVRRCRIAGVEVHMLTGDHIRTATAIAHEVGILSPGMPSALAKTMVMTAGQFDALSDAEIDALPVLPKVIARCSPATKVRMVEALHRRKAFCVMTGDGVNDSPALKRADVGIAMGLTGSDVAKDAADLVLTDDNFASIVRAVEEGRRLFDNIQKFIMHLLISNISQVVLLLIGLAFQDKNKVSVFPLSPLEILWVNMITSSFLALGLGLEEASPDVMTRPPHDLRTGVFTWEVIIDKSLYGVTMGLLCLISFVIVIFGANDGNLGHDCNHSFNDSCEPVYRARATVFAVLSFLLLLTAWEVKHFTRSLFRLNPERHTGPLAVFHAIWYNRFLFWAVVAGFVITFPVIYIPVFNSVVFKHTGISWEWGVVIGACVAYLSVVEGWKAIKRWRRWGSAGRKVNGIAVVGDLEEGYEFIGETVERKQG